MFDQIDAFFSLLERFKRYSSAKIEPDTVASRFVLLFEKHGIHRNQIPRFFDHGLTLADVVDQVALVDMLHAGRLGGAILDLTDPEPIPPDHPLWDAPNCHVTMHQAGLPTQNTRQAAADRFVANCERFLAGEPLVSQVDLTLGY